MKNSWLRFVLFWILLMCSIVQADNYEIRIFYDSSGDPNLYMVVKHPTDNNVWDVNSSAWSDWFDANEPNYATYLSLISKDDWGCRFPSGITDAGIYPFVIYERQGDEPNITNDVIVGSDEMPWDGSAEITNSTIYAEISGLDGAAMRGTDDAALAATALSNAMWTDARAGYLDNLDVAVSTRLPSADYNDPNLTEILTKLNQLIEDANNLKATRGVPGGG